MIEIQEELSVWNLNVQEWEFNMENASKALLMAAGVLIGLMVISLGVYLFTQFGGTSAQIHNNIEESQIAQFNSQFTAYQARDNVTIHDIVSMANLATQNNQSYEFPKQTATGNNNYIAVLLNGTAIEYGFGTSSEAVEERYNQLILNEVNSINASTGLKNYTVQVEVSDVTKRVYRVICTAR